MPNTTETSSANPPAPVAAPGTALRRLLVLVIVAGTLVGGFFLYDDLTFENLRDNRADLIAFRDTHYVLTVLAFIAAYVVLVAFSLPGALVATLTGGFLFGLFPGVLYNVTGATIGATAIFLAARWGLGDRLAARMDTASGAVRRIKEGIRDNEWSVLFLMRLVPAVPFFVANLIPALVGVRLSRFVITTFLGIIPGGLVYTWVGSGLSEVFASGATPDYKLIFAPKVLGPILALCALAALPIVLKAFKKKERGR